MREGRVWTIVDVNSSTNMVLDYIKSPIILIFAVLLLLFVIVFIYIFCQIIAGRTQRSNNYGMYRSQTQSCVGRQYIGGSEYVSIYLNRQCG